MATSAGGGIGNVVSFKADGDISDMQYHGVGFQADGEVGTTGITGTTVIVGVLLNKPVAAGAAADVQIDGVAKIEMSGPCDEGDLLICGTDGRWAEIAKADAANSYISAQALEAATTTIAAGGGDIISAKLLGFVGTTS